MRRYDIGAVSHGLKELIAGIIAEGYMAGSMHPSAAQSAEEVFEALMQLLGAVQAPVVLVSDDVSGVTGFVVGYITDNLGERIGVIHLLWVKPEHRRKGISRELVDELLAHFQSHRCHAVVVQTQGNNVAARALFASYGMSEEEITYGKKLT